MADVSDVVSPRTTEMETRAGQDHCQTLDGQDNKVFPACQSCQHLYAGEDGVILSPIALLHPSVSPTSTSTSTPASTSRSHASTSHTCSSLPTTSEPVSATSSGLPKPSRSLLKAPLRPWTYRRYDGLCECGSVEGMGECRCGGSSKSPRCLLDPKAPWWRKVKVALLVLAAILPWAFLIAYLVLSYY